MNRCLRLALLAVLIPVASMAQAAELFLVQLDTVDFKAGETVTLQVVALNPSVAAANRRFPPKIAAAVVAGTVREEIEFRPVNATQLSVEVPPNGFSRVAYAAVLPAGFEGSARLEVALENAPSFTLEIDSAAPTGESAARTDRRFTVQEGMDRETTETSYFKRHIFPYEPFYFIAGPEAPAAKFQVSIKYRLVNTEIGGDGEAEGWLYRQASWMDGLHLAYTQRSLWDLEAESAPFLDSSYLPELLYERPNLIDPERGWLERIGGQIGFQHESNGKDGASSRSLNIAYLRMPFVFGDEDDFYVTIEPRAWFYVGELTDNPDLEDYRGHVDLRLKAGWARGLQVAGWLRAGDDFEHGSTQIDVTYPLHHLLSRSFSLYLQAQYFNGYGESLLYYNERSEVWRVGIGLFR